MDVLAEQPMRADDDIDAARLEPRERVSLLALGHEAAQRAHRDGVGREALLERDQVLRREHGGGHQHGHLCAGLYGLEGRAQRDLGLTVADIADHQAIHGRLAFQVSLDVDGGAQLVGRLLVGKGRLHLRLPRRVLTERAAAGLGAVGIKAQQVASEIPDGVLDAGPGALPLSSAQSAQLRMVATGIAGDALDLFDRYPHATLLSEVQFQEVTLLGAASCGRPAHEAVVARDAVIDVDDGIPGLEALQQVTGHDAAHGPRPAHPHGAEELTVGDEFEPVGATSEAAIEAAFDEGQAAAWHGLTKIGQRGGAHAGFLEDLREAGRLVGGEDDAGIFAAPAPDGGGQVADGRRGQDGLVPAEWVATRRCTVGLRLPGQLERGSLEKRCLPLAWRGIGAGPACRDLPGPLQLGPAVVCL